MKKTKEKGQVYEKIGDPKYDYEFSYELGAEVMKDKCERKDSYLNKLNDRENTHLETAEEIVPLHHNNSTYDDIQVFNNQNYYNKDEYQENEYRPKKSNK